MPHAFTIIVDGEDYPALDHSMTANQILALAGLSTPNYYLIEISGKKQESYQNRGDSPIRLHEKAKFVSVFIGATPVSDTPLAGVALFAAQLRRLDYDVTEMPHNHVVFSYTVESGKYENKLVRLGFQVPSDFPFTPPSGPHVSPHIHPINPSGLHPTGGIHHSQGRSVFGDDFQYWSRPFPNWTATKRGAADYMAFIRHLWATQ